jgi:L-threonylcarbamoyladenylate synthase
VESAIRRIFQVKGRPAANPLIVHISDPEQIHRLAVINDSALALANAFWPGPLTIVLRKLNSVSNLVTAGGDTVAIRMPRHPVALEIISRAGVPVAAPSANRFTQLSPTAADQIDPEIASQVEMVVNGGPCEIGIESTVVDCTGKEPVILRKGMISSGQISSMFPDCSEQPAPDGRDRKSPGLYPRHYSPRTPVRLSKRLGGDEAGITFDPPQNDGQFIVERSPAIYAKELYRSLFELDRLQVPEIVIQMPPTSKEWEAIWDRLVKASHGASASDPI